MMSAPLTIFEADAVLMLATGVGVYLAAVVVLWAWIFLTGPMEE